MGINNSFLTIMANDAIIPPNARLPVSPIKTWAGYALYQRKPTQAPTNAAIKIDSSLRLGMYIMFRYSAIRTSPLTKTKTPRPKPIIALTPVASPSSPSVILAPLDTAVTINITIMIYNM